MRPKFYSVSLYDQLFSRYKVVEKPKCTDWPQNDFNHLTIISTLYELNTHSPQRPKVHSIPLYGKPFSSYKVVENRKCIDGP